MARRVLIVGGSVGGATAAVELRRAGLDVLIVEKELRKAKPCGGAVPPAAFREFDIPQSLIDRKVHNCLVVSPSGRCTAVPVAGTDPGDNDFVAMVCREVFDAFLRQRAQEQGAELIHATLTRLAVESDGVRAVCCDANGHERELRADAVIGADGAYSTVARQLGLPAVPRAVAIQERIVLPDHKMARWEDTADLYLGKATSPDLYAWAFPKKDHVAVGVGVGPEHGRAVRQLLSNLKYRLGDALDGGRVVLREAHALPMHPRKHMAFDRAMLIGDAAGLVVHTSGEGIYWAMKSGQLAAQVLAEYIERPTIQSLRAYELRWWRQYGTMYRFLRWLQWWGYKNECQMEVFTDMCANADVQRLTFDSYMHKQMAPAPWRTQLSMTYDILVAQFRYYMLKNAVAQAALPEEIQAF